MQDAIFAWVGKVIMELWPFDFATNMVRYRPSKAELMVYLQKNCTLNISYSLNLNHLILGININQE